MYCMKRENDGLLIEEFNKCKVCGDLLKLDASCLLQHGNTPFVIIGESPAKDGWIISKKAFYNKDGKLQASGKVLSKLLAIIDYKIEDIYFTECCKCVIEDRKILAKCAVNCRALLYRQLENIDCDLILTMGLYPSQILLNKKIAKFADYVGKIFNIKIGQKSFKLIPIYHPSPLNPKGYKDNVPIFRNIKRIIDEGNENIK